MEKLFSFIYLTLSRVFSVKLTMKMEKEIWSDPFDIAHFSPILQNES